MLMGVDEAESDTTSVDIESESARLETAVIE